MLFFGKMNNFRNGAKMCVGIDGVPRILFLDVRDSQWTVCRNCSDDHPTSISQNSAAFTKYLFRMHNKTQGQSQQNSVKGIVRKRQLRGSADLRLDAPSLDHNRHLRREVKPMGYSQRRGKTACTNTYFQYRLSPSNP